MFKKEEFKILSALLKMGRNTLIFSFLVGSFANAAPQSGKVTLGQANISTKGSVTNITQSTKKASINWNKFNINKNETVNFKQPNKSSITLNRVIGSERSVINGALNANGQVWILNSNGVLFGKNAKINTAGLLATTKNLTDKDFLAGKYNFKGNSKNSVINLGEIEITDTGYAALLGHKVSNEGSIKAIKGTIKLVGASEYSVNLNGNSLVSLKVEKSFIDSLVENKGALIANGGEIYLTTSGAEELLKGTVNNTGVIEANSFEDITGYVELFAHGGTVNVDGTIDTSSDSSKGGDILVQANNIKFNSNTIIDSSGETGGGDIFVGGGWQGKDATLYNATDVEVNHGATINSSAINNGDAGTIVFWSDDAMRFAGEIKAVAGKQSGDGGQVEVSGKERLSFLGKVDTSSKNGENGLLLLDPGTLTIVDGSGGQSGTYDDWSTHDTWGGNAYVIPETVLESLKGDVTLTATSDIIMENLSDNELTLSADNIYFFSNDESSQSSSGGFRMMDLSDTIFLNKGAGSEIVFQGGNIYSRNSDISNASIYIGNVKTSGADVLFHTKRSYAATPMIVKGDITTNGGDITIEAGTRFGLTNSKEVDVTFDGLVNTGGGSFSSEMTGKVNVNGGMNLGNGTATFGGTNTNINSLIESTNDVTINTPLNFGVGSGITTNGTITFGSTTSMLSGGDLTLTASDFIFNDTFNGNSSDIILKPYAASTDVYLGSKGVNLGMEITQTALDKLDNFDNITIGRTDGTGSTTIKENISVSTTNTLELINDTINVTNGTLTNTTGDITLTGNKQNITNNVNANNSEGAVTLQQATAANGISLGGDTVLGADLTQLSAKQLIIGRDDGGDVTFTSDMTTSFDTVHIKTSGNIIGIDGGLSLRNLALSAGGGITLTDSTFDFTTLALTSGANSEISSTNAFNIGSIDGINGINTNGTDLILNLNTESGTITQTQNIDANLLNLIGSNVNINLLNSANNLNLLSANVNSIDYLNSSSLGLNEITSNEKINIATTSGDLDIKNNITTSSTANDAIVLNAAKNENAGTSTGGDVIYTSGILNVGVGGRTTIYTGNLSSTSTSLAQDGNFRYNSDETSTNYTLALGTGTHVIYREQPTIKVSSEDKTVSYGDNIVSGYTNAYAGFVNNDTNIGISGTSIYSVSGGTSSSSGNKNVGVYDTFYTSGLTSELGYAFADNSVSTNELAIEQKVLNVSGLTIAGKTYNGTNNASISSAGTIDKIVGDDVSFSTIANFNNKNVESIKTVDLDYTLSGTDKNNYLLTDVTNQASSAQILKRDINVSFTTTGKTYDGSTGAEVSFASWDNLVSGDNLSSSSVTASFNDKNAGADKSVTIDSNSLSGTDADNYNLVSSSATTADIDKRDINASFTTSAKIYDGNTGAEVSFASWDNLVSGDNLSSSSVTASFNDKNAGAGKSVTIDSNSLSGTDAGNYNLVSSSATTADIDRRDISASFTTSDKTYDGNTGAEVSFASWDNLVSGDNLSSSSVTASFNDKNAEAGKSVTIDSNSLSGTDAGNYNLVSSSATTADIDRRDISASFTTSDKTYDGSTDAEVSFASWDNLVSGDNLSSSSLTASFNDKSAGAGKSVTIDSNSLSGTDAGNYNLVSSSATTADIDRRDISASFVATNKTYDGSSSANVSFNSWDNLVENDVLNASSITASFNNKNAGNDKVVTIDNISLAGEDAHNYNLVSSDSTKADINKRDINASFVASDKTYDGSSSANVSFNSWDNLVENDDLNASSITASFNDKNAGNYKVVTIDNISLTGEDADNYNLVSSDSTKADINKRDINASFVASNKIYNGETLTELKFSSWDNYLNSDDLSAANYVGNFVDPYSGNNKDIIVTGTILTGKDKDNYNLVGSTSTKADITENKVEYILASIDNTTSIKTPISNDIKTPIDSLQRKGINIQRTDIVSTPKVGKKTQKITHSEVQSIQGTTETKVPLRENSILTINGSGVNLTSKDTQVEQVFYITDYRNDK